MHLPDTIISEYGFTRTTALLHSGQFSSVHLVRQWTCYPCAKAALTGRVNTGSVYRRAIPRSCLWMCTCLGVSRREKTWGPRRRPVADQLWPVLRDDQQRRELISTSSSLPLPVCSATSSVSTASCTASSAVSSHTLLTRVVIMNSCIETTSTLTLLLTRRADRK